MKNFKNVERDVRSAVRIAHPMETGIRMQVYCIHNTQYIDR